MDWTWWLAVWLVSALAGANCGMLGVGVIAWRLPMATLAVTHLSLASMTLAAVYLEQSWTDDYLWAVGCGTAVLAVGLWLWWQRRGAVRDLSADSAVWFAMSLALVALAQHVASTSGDADRAQQVQQLLWGSLLLSDWADVTAQGLLLAALLATVTLARGRLLAVLHAPMQADLAGLPVMFVQAIWLGLLAVCVSITLPAAGGLLLYGLLIAPAISAVRVCRSARAVLPVACGFGLIGAWGGMGLSVLLDLPPGVCIVLVSGALFVITRIWRRMN